MRQSEKTQNRNFLIGNQVIAVFLLGMLLLYAFVPAFSSAAPEGMVYCPLSHKFQPVHAPAKKTGIIPFNDICVSRETKDVLFQKIVKYSFKKISLEETNLNTLAFDFFANGESVFKELPNLPQLPPGNLIKQINSSAVVNNNYEHQFAFQETTRYFSAPLLARPPTASSIVFFSNDLTHRSDELSRHIAPRAPPVRS